MSMRRATTSTAALIVFAAPAMANSGTAFMVKSFVHFLILNFVFGPFEAFVILYSCCYLFHVREVTWKKALTVVQLMLVANYMSGAVGYRAVKLLESRYDYISVYEVHDFVATCIYASIPLTLLIEYPFVAAGAWFAGLRKRFFRRVAAVHVVAHVFTLAVTLWFMQSAVTLPDRAVIDRGLVARQTMPGSVIYLSHDKRELRSVRLNGTDDELVATIPPDTVVNKLALARAEEPGVLNVLASNFSDDQQSILSRFLAKPPYLTGDGDPIDASRQRDLRPAGERDIVFVAERGMGMQTITGDERIRIIFDGPGTATDLWPQPCLTLPGDLFVFNVGEELVLFSMSERKVGVLARGSDPIYVPD